MRYCFVYITAPSMDEARTLARTLVEEQLAACANILPSMESVYRWKGELQHDQEVVLIAKSTYDRLDELTQRVISLHPYETPCVVALPVEGGHAGYLDWISGQLKKDP